VGCDANTVSDIFCTASKADIEEMRTTFENLTGKNLSDRLRSELSGEHEKLILQLLNGSGRGNGVPSDEHATNCANRIQSIIKNGTGMMGGLKADAQKELVDVIISCSPSQCKLLCRMWEKIFPSEGSLEKCIKKHFSGALEYACLALLQSPVLLFTQHLKRAMDGIGTNEKEVAAIIGGNQKDMVQEIKSLFFTNYGRELSHSVQKEVGGHFQTAILEWLKGVDPTGTKMKNDSFSFFISLMVYIYACV
jgi:hypothetical protein